MYFLFEGIASGTNDDCSVHRRSSCASNGSITSQTTAQSERKNSNISLQFRNLTIFAIQETVRRSMIENISKIDRRYYAGDHFLQNIPTAKYFTYQEWMSKEICS